MENLFGFLFTVFIYWCIYKLIKIVVKFIIRLPNIYLFENKKDKQYNLSKINTPVVADTNVYDINYKSWHKDKHLNDDDYDLSLFSKRDSLVTFYEKKFLNELKEVCFEKYDIYPQIHLGAIFKPKSKYKNWGPLSRLNKRVDFLIVDKELQSPLLGIEFDDISHEKKERRLRDKFVEALFLYNNIPFVRYNYDDYSLEELKRKISKSLDKVDIF